MEMVGSLKLLPVWVNPNHLVESARILLRGHRVGALGVVDGERLVGLVTGESLGQLKDGDAVSCGVQPLGTAFQAGTSVRRVAEVFVEENLAYAPVLEGERFLGLVTCNMLLKEMSRSWDPLTGLSWSDRLREWGVETLKTGREVTILFIDIDDFGVFNKRYGHIVGDSVLKEIAEMLAATIDPEFDLLVRYGGDEFAIGTVRSREEAEELGQELRRRVLGLRVPETSEPIGFCLGIQGGRRTIERESIHFASTLDNLINLASRQCLEQKRYKERLSGGGEPIDEEEDEYKMRRRHRPPSTP
jgi:IMP dehydrogenase